jgi:hypothetical protein
VARKAARNALQKLHVQPEAMSRLGLLVALPSFAVRPMLLTCGQAAQLVASQDAMDGGSGNRERVELGVWMRTRFGIGTARTACFSVSPQY